jgi:hypothetical protein
MLALLKLHEPIPESQAMQASRFHAAGECPEGSRVALGTGYQASCVDDPVEARAIWYVAPRSGAVMCPAYVARPYDRWP